MNCFADCGRQSMTPTITLCLECSQKNSKREEGKWRIFRENWILELEMYKALCFRDGWQPWTPVEVKEKYLKMWPNYTPQKGYEQKIYELQKELGITPTVPHHVNLCPCTTAQGKEINEMFEAIEPGSESNAWRWWKANKDKVLQVCEDIENA